MNRRKLIAAILSVAAVLAAAGALAWHFWPEPPPTTADQVVGTVMVEDNPLEMSPKDLDRWVNSVADVVERLPPHEMEKLLRVAMQDQEMQRRFESLQPETRRRLMSLISQEQQARLGVEMATSWVAFMRAMPKSVRVRMIREMHKRRDRGHREGGGHPKMTKDRLAEFHAATTPRQRAQFVRAMREMRVMLEEAGIHD